MFDVAPSELLLIVIAAVVVIGPKDLPRALYKLGQVMGKARGMARHFRSGVDAMIREAELEELQKQWAKQNEQIMADTRNNSADIASSAEAEQSAAYLPSPDNGWPDTGAPGTNDDAPHAKPEAGVTLGELASKEAASAEHGDIAQAASPAPSQSSSTAAQTSLPLDEPSTIPEGTRPA